MYSTKNNPRGPNDARPWTGSQRSSMVTKEPTAHKPSRRGKYVQRACDLCQRRKVKCEGGLPCLRCRASDKECCVGQRPVEVRSPGVQKRSYASRPEICEDRFSQHQTDWEGEDMEWQTGTDEQSSDSPHRRHPEVMAGPKGPTQGPTSSAPASSPHNLGGDCTQTMVGELSAFHALNPSATEIGSQGPDTTISATSEPQGNDMVVTKTSRGWLPSIMDMYEVVPDRRNFDISLDLFFELAYSFYPLVHRPWVRQAHEEMWQESCYSANKTLAKDASKRLSVGMVFLCLAVGACQEPSRMDPKAHCQAAGYSLYRVAMVLLQPFLDLTQEQPVTMQSVQALGLAVLYLIRIDAIGKAERILGLAVSGAHILGLHRHAAYDQISLHDDQMRRRLFWSLYGLDCRIGVESGRPLRLQDDNISTLKPLNLSEQFMERARLSGKKSSELVAEIETELSSVPQTGIPFLLGAISYGRITGLLWNHLYGPKNGPARIEQRTGSIQALDLLLEQDRAQLPVQLRYDRTVPFEEQFGGQVPWKVKLAIVTHVRHNFLRLIMRRSVYVVNGPAAEEEKDIIYQAECARMASEIVEDYIRIPPRFARYTFPMVHHLTSATMILFSIVMKTPALADVCRAPALAGVEALVEDSSKTWLSGKMTRTIEQLDGMVRCGLLNSVNRTAGTRLPQPMAQTGTESESRTADRPTKVGTGDTALPNLDPRPNGSLESGRPKSRPWRAQRLDSTSAPRPQANTGDGVTFNLNNERHGPSSRSWPWTTFPLNTATTQHTVDLVSTQPWKDTSRWTFNDHDHDQDNNNYHHNANDHDNDDDAGNGNGFDPAESAFHTNDVSWLLEELDQDGSWWDPVPGVVAFDFHPD